MQKIDISENPLYIKKIINVWRSAIKNCRNPIFVNGRHSDALVYIISGSCTYSFDDGNTFTVNTGDILYLAKSAVYRMDVHVSNHQYIYTDFEFDSDELRKSDYYSPYNSSWENMFTKLLSSHKLGFTECACALYKIYGEILKIGNRHITKKSEIELAREYIDKNYKDVSLSVSDLAEGAKMSEVYFRRLFKKQYNISPIKYLISIRIDSAKEFLHHPFISLEECSRENGFSSVQYFCRVFKKETGLTPSEYRKKWG